MADDDSDLEPLSSLKRSVNDGKFSDDDFVERKSKKSPVDNGEVSDDDFVEKPSKKSKKEKKHKKHKSKKKKEKKRLKREHGGSFDEAPEPKISKKAKPTSHGLREIKEKVPLQRLLDAMQDYKWWEDPPNEGDIKWNTLEHNGVGFPPPYQPHGATLLYDGKPVVLTPAQEEICTLYADMPLDGPQLGDPNVAPTFNKNFFADFKTLLGKNSVVKDFKKCDFSQIRAHCEVERDARKNITKAEKEAKKAIAEEHKMKFSFALVDGHLQAVANVMVEPPGLFRGRGLHPKTGTYKQRVMPEQITINCGEDDPVPPCPLAGHSWGRIVHKQDVTWLAYWKENVAGGTKYVWLGSSSKFKGQSDIEKYEKARRLKQNITKIRADYEKKLKSKDHYERQLGTAMWVIDRLALRVGGEKDDDEADTVGCCSLRVEHVSVDMGAQTLTLDFPGKDSMRHFQTYDIVDQYAETGKLVLENFKRFVTSREPSDEVFSELKPQGLNEHLRSLMPGLTAKVFRTYNASVTLQDQLPHNVIEGSTDQEKVLSYNTANREVAILCNHQKTVSNAMESSLDKMSQQVSLLEEQIEILNGYTKRIAKGKEVPLKPELAKDATVDDKKRVAHMFSRQPKVEDVLKSIEAWKGKLQTQQLHLKNKDDNKTVALGTSKINYMDPRISVAWAKRNECPIEKIFAATLRDKFPWAMSVDDTFKF